MEREKKKIPEARIPMDHPGVKCWFSFFFFLFNQVTAFLLLEHSTYYPKMAFLIRPRRPTPVPWVSTFEAVCSSEPAIGDSFLACLPISNRDQIPFLVKPFHQELNNSIIPIPPTIFGVGNSIDGAGRIFFQLCVGQQEGLLLLR